MAVIWQPTLFLIKTISAISDLQAALIFSTMIQVNWHFHSGEDVQNRFSNDGHLGFWIRTILAIFYLQVAKVLPTKFRVNWPFG